MNVSHPSAEVASHRRSLTMGVIIGVVADEFDVTRLEVVSPRRDPKSVLARHAGMWLGRRLTHLSYPRLGRAFGGRDHSSIMHGCQRIDRDMKQDAAFAERMIELMDALSCFTLTGAASGSIAQGDDGYAAPQQPSIDTIMRIVAPTLGVTRLDILSHRTDAKSVLARDTGMWLARRLTKHSLPTIGLHFERDHTTVRRAVMRIDAVLAGDPDVGQIVLGLMDSLTLPPEAA